MSDSFDEPQVKAADEDDGSGSASGTHEASTEFGSGTDSAGSGFPGGDGGGTSSGTDDAGAEGSSFEGTDSSVADGTDSGTDATDGFGTEGTDSTDTTGTDTTDSTDTTDGFGTDGDGTDSTGTDGTETDGFEGTEGTDAEGTDGTDTDGFEGTEATGTTTPPSEITVIHTEPTTNASEAALEQRLSIGEGTAAEALAWFQGHGFPGLTGEPTWNGELWLFPDPAGTGATGVAIVVGPDGGPSSIPAAPGGSGGSGPASSARGSAGGTDGASGFGGAGLGGPGDSGSAGGVGSPGGTDGSGSAGPGGAGAEGPVGGTDPVTAPPTEPSVPGGGGTVPTSGTTAPIPTPAPAPGASPPSPPVPGSVEADFARGMAIGRAHGQFLADADQHMTSLKADQGGATLWDIMTPLERGEAVERIHRGFRNLPQLPQGVDAAHDKALHDGFAQTAGRTYEVERWLNRAVVVGFELLKGAIIGAAATPSTVAIGAVSNDRWSDCAAQTASLALRSAGQPEIEAAMLRANFGLPRVAMNFSEAVAFAKNWFTRLGLTLSPKNSIQELERGRAAAGDYVLFMRGGPEGGHVVFASVSADGTMVIRDGQIGLEWPSVMLAQNKLGMQASGAFRIESIDPP